MNNKDIVIGMKVVPHSKSVGCSLDTCEVYKEMVRQKQPFLYITGRDSDLNNIWLLGNNQIDDCSKFGYYKDSDFVKYDEEYEYHRIWEFLEGIRNSVNSAIIDKMEDAFNVTKEISNTNRGIYKITDLDGKTLEMDILKNKESTVVIGKDILDGVQYLICVADNKEIENNLKNNLLLLDCSSIFKLTDLSGKTLKMKITKNERCIIVIGIDIVDGTQYVIDSIYNEMKRWR